LKVVTLMYFSSDSAMVQQYIRRRQRRLRSRFGLTSDHAGPRRQRQRSVTPRRCLLRGDVGEKGGQVLRVGEEANDVDVSS
jgi:hypothetical protein